MNGSLIINKQVLYWYTFKITLNLTKLLCIQPYDILKIKF